MIARIGGEHFIEFGLEGSVPEGIVDSLRTLPAVVQVRKEDETYCLSVTAPHQSLPALLEALQSSGLTLAKLTTRHASLEDVFVTLTGRHLRDDA